jgi:murein DD-endopeptidase MepM/ murein hydrolase activator NlpD
MRGKQSIAAAMAVMALAGAAGAEPCASPAGEVHLSTQKPVLGNDAHFVSGFGMRLHPLLNERRMHTGVDWEAASGTPVIAAAAGRVIEAGHKGQYGNVVIIDHGGGVETLYAHLSEIGVKEGDCVADGARIGAAGSTGLTANTGVHFEVHRAGTAVDPLKETTTGK